MSRNQLKLSGSFSAGMAFACFVIVLNHGSNPVACVSLMGAAFFAMVSTACFTSIKSNQHGN